MVSGAAQYLSASLALMRAGQNAKARACLSHTLKVKQHERTPWSWGVLGELLRREGADATRIEAVFAEARSGGLYARTFRIL